MFDSLLGRALIEWRGLNRSLSNQILVIQRSTNCGIVKCDLDLIRTYRGWGGETVWRRKGCAMLTIII